MSLGLGLLKVCLSVSLNQVFARIYCVKLQGSIDRESQTRKFYKNFKHSPSLYDM